MLQHLPKMAAISRTLRPLATSLWVILLVAAIARVAFAADQARQISSEVLSVVPFSNEAGSIAYSLTNGHGFSSPFRRDTGPTAWLAPVYPVLLAGIFKVFGPFTLRAFYAALSLNLIFSMLVTIALYLAGKRLGGIAVASVAAWLWALFPNAFVIPFEWIWDTCLSALLGAGILLATLAVGDCRKSRPWIAYGLLWGVALLTNPAFASLLPFLFAWLLWNGQKSIAGFSWRRPALAAAVALLCCLPWTIRNYAVFHRFIPLRSNLPFELWLGNNEVFDDQAHSPMGSRVTIYGETRRYFQLGETSFMDEKWSKAKSFILSHSALEMRLTRDRIFAMWIGTAHPIRDFRGTDSLLARFSLVANALATLGSVLGMVALVRTRNSLAFPVATVAVIFPCIYYVTHASLRYRHPADPALLLLTAFALVELSRWSVRKTDAESTQPA